MGMATIHIPKRCMGTGLSARRVSLTRLRARGVGQDARVGSGIVGASARKLLRPPSWVWYRPSWGVPVEPQAVMSVAVSTAASKTAAVVNGLLRECVMPANMRPLLSDRHRHDYTSSASWRYGIPLAAALRLDDG